ncbi:hypothetical protein HED60_13845 [Planctomycetales bacterium ZRK34]|nr:hypothetical protein HED60_13845 [Planctomycetales bacterium ZRK34]
MQTTANNPVEVSATSKQIFDSLRLALLQCHWSDGNQPMRLVAELRRCRLDNDGYVTDMPSERNNPLQVIEGAKARTTKVVPDIVGLAKLRAKNGQPELQNALESLIQELCKITEEDGDI